MDGLFNEHEGGEGEQEVYEDEEITQEDAWMVINSFFRAKGLVCQQIDSFDEFIVNTIQELVDDTGEIVVTPENQFIPGQDTEAVRRESTYILTHTHDTHTRTTHTHTHTHIHF